MSKLEPTVVWVHQIPEIIYLPARLQTPSVLYNMLKSPEEELEIAMKWYLIGLSMKMKRERNELEEKINEIEKEIRRTDARLCGKCGVPLIEKHGDCYRVISHLCEVLSDE